MQRNAERSGVGARGIGCTAASGRRQRQRMQTDRSRPWKATVTEARERRRCEAWLASPELHAIGYGAVAREPARLGRAVAVDDHRPEHAKQPAARDATAMTASRAMRNRQHAAAVQRIRGRLRVASVVALGAACTRVHGYANPSALKAAALHVYCAHSDYSYSAHSRPLRAVSATVTDRGRRGFPTAARHERVARPSTRAPGTAALTGAAQRTAAALSSGALT